MKHNPLISHFPILFLVFIFVGIRQHNLIICNGDSNSVYCNFHILSAFSIDIFEIKRLSAEKFNKMLNWLWENEMNYCEYENWIRKLTFFNTSFLTLNFLLQSTQQYLKYLCLLIVCLSVSGCLSMRLSTPLAFYLSLY